jgi:hypothetical protein
MGFPITSGMAKSLPDFFPLGTETIAPIIYEETRQEAKGSREIWEKCGHSV